jgi:hypothetical protein
VRNARAHVRVVLGWICAQMYTSALLNMSLLSHQGARDEGRYSPFEQVFWGNWRKHLRSNSSSIEKNSSHSLPSSRAVGRKSDLIQEIAVETASRENAKYLKIPRHFEDCWPRRMVGRHKACPAGWSEINPGWGDRDR